MLFRLLYLFALSCLFFALLNLILSWVKRQGRIRSEDRLKKAEEMVFDPQCQTYLPKSEAISRGGHYFCSEECARVYLSRSEKKDEAGGMKDP